MPAIAMDPNNMTRDKLKAELQKFNIPLPPSGSRKDAYIELYKSSVHNINNFFGKTLLDYTFFKRSWHH